MVECRSPWHITFCLVLNTNAFHPQGVPDSELEAELRQARAQLAVAKAKLGASTVRALHGSECRVLEGAPCLFVSMLHVSESLSTAMQGCVWGGKSDRGGGGMRESGPMSEELAGRGV